MNTLIIAHSSVQSQANDAAVLAAGDLADGTFSVQYEKGGSVWFIASWAIDDDTLAKFTDAVTVPIAASLIQVIPGAGRSWLADNGYTAVPGTG